MSNSFDRLKPVLFNIPGWHTKRNIVVFESDDWGSIRIPSKEIYDYLLRDGYPIDKSPYGKDTLESNDDISCLMEVLSGIKNIDCRNPVFTLNNIVANPNFEKISKNNFSTYYYELFTDTYNRYPNHGKSLGLITEGVEKEIFKPQLHGREHLNTYRWINSLKLGQIETHKLFKQYMFGLPYSLTREKRNDFQRAFDFDNEGDALDSCGIIRDACNIFNAVWGFRSESFIAPNFFWDDGIEEFLYENGINTIQGQRAQYLTNYDGTYKAKYHYTGQKNKFGQLYLVRNCYFEPSFDPNKDWIDSCLKEISNSFLLRKPAIISSHRVNYIGGIDSSNRDRGLAGLSQLLKGVIKNWPETEFMSTDQLGSLIRQ